MLLDEEHAKESLVKMFTQVGLEFETEYPFGKDIVTYPLFAVFGLFFRVKSTCTEVFVAPG